MPRRPWPNRIVYKTTADFEGSSAPDNSLALSDIYFGTYDHVVPVMFLTLTVIIRSLYTALIRTKNMLIGEIQP